ncbi:MAG: thioredoxin domain-containing protein [Nannocystaceae bacterium]
MPSSIVVTCASCGQRNRVPVTKAGARGKCGKCKATLASPARPVEVERADDLRALLEHSEVPVLVDFWAQWCGPCRMVAPEVAKVATQHGGEWLVVKANTEVDPRLGAEHGVRSIPMMAVFRGGHELARVSGARPAPAIEAFVRESLQRG